MSAEPAERIPTLDQLRLDAERPWPGLVAFHEADAAFFHGRDSDIGNLYRMVMRERLTVLFGMSGLGKTSLLQAGLFPKLRDENLLPIRIRLDYADQSPPLLQQIKQAIVVFAGAANVESPPVQDGETLWEYFHRKGADFWNARNRVMTPVLVFDQFEEVFTLGRDNPARAAEIKEIIGELADLIEGHCPEAVKSRLDQYPEEAQQYAFNHHPYKLVFSLREDFLADFEGLRRQIPSVIHNRLRLRRMHGEQALEVVTKAGGHLVDTDVALAIVNFVAAAQASGSGLLEALDIEPALLSLICHELNEKRIQIGAAQIDAALLAGSRAEILEGFYERCMANQAPELRHFIEDRLITTSGYRDSVAYEGALETSGVTAEALGRLVDQRLIRIEERSGQRRIELTHDVLTGVVRKSRDQRRLREQQERTEHARREAEEREERVRQDLRRSHRRFLYSLVLTVIAIGAASWAYISYRAAEKAKTVAEHAQQEARIATIKRRVSQAETEFKISPTRGLLLAVEALNASRLDQDTCTPQVTCIQFAAEALIKLLSATGGTPLIGHEGQVLAVSFSTDGRLLATADGGTANLWRIDNPRTPFAVLRYLSGGDAVSLSADGRLLATAGFGAVHLWRIDKPEPAPHAFPIMELGNMVPTSASFSSNGKLVLTAAGVGATFLWRLDQLETPIADLSSQAGNIVAASFTSDEKFLVTANTQGQVQRWRLDQLDQFDRKHKPVLQGVYPIRRPASKQKPVLQVDLKARIETMSFSSDGKYLVIPRQLNTESLQSMARLVNLDDPGSWEDKPVAQGEYTLRAASLSADGKLVAIADDSGTVRVWRTDKPDFLHKPFAKLRGHEGLVYAASFSPDGKFIATGGDDRTVRIWRVDQPMAIANHDQSSNWMMRLDELIHLAGETVGRNLTREEWLDFFPDEEYHSTFPDLPAPKIGKQE